MPEIVKMLVLSTAHLSEDTCTIYLSNIALGLEQGSVIAFEKGDYGYFVYVPEDPADSERPDVPLELRSAIHVARTHGCGWVMFDRDGDTVSDLPSFNW